MKTDTYYEKLIRPLLFQLDPEDAHEFVHVMLKMFGGVLPSLPYSYVGNDLQVELAGRILAHPVGLAAGFDKNAKLLGQLAGLGFSFAEIGSITARASAGNPRPRLFRLPADQALINRLGLNGEGADVVSQRIKSSRASLPIAVNIAKTHDPSIAGDKAVEDFVYSFNRIKDLDLLYVTLNASCPNTREGCMKEKAELSAVLTEIQKANVRRLPLFLKVSPDSSDQLIEDMIELGTVHGLAGYVCGNTTTNRSALTADQAALEEIGFGGMSGAPLRSLALAMVRKFARLKRPEQSIIAVGGIASGLDAYEFLLAGATALSIYTALIYRGPTVVQQICCQLSQLLKRDGISLKEAIGAGLPA